MDRFNNIISFSPLGWIITLSLGIHFLLILASVSVQNYDLLSYKKIGGQTLIGNNVYPHLALLHHPYFPLFLYIEAFGEYISQYGIASSFIIKSILSFFNLATIPLIYRMTKQNTLLTLMYAINPISLLTTTVHGQFDSIPIFFLLLGVNFFNGKHFVWAFIALSTAVTFKTWPIFFLIPLIRRLPQKKNVILLLIIPLLSVLIYSYLYKVNIIEIVHTIVSYRSYISDWGFGIVLKTLSVQIPAIGSIYALIFLFMFIGYSLFLRKKSLFREISLLILFFYSFSYGLGLQYVSWIIPFLFLDRPKYWKIFLFIASGYFLLQYPQWILCYPCPPIPNWLSHSVQFYTICFWGFIVYMWCRNMYQKDLLQ